MSKCDKSINYSSDNRSIRHNFQTILKEAYWRLRHCREKAEVKWQNGVSSQNLHNIADNIELFNYY